MSFLFLPSTHPATVTIAANDDPYGVIGFVGASLSVVIKETEDVVTDENGRYSTLKVAFDVHCGIPTCMHTVMIFSLLFICL